MAARAASAWSARAIGFDHLTLAAILARRRRCSGVTLPPRLWRALRSLGRDGGSLAALSPFQVPPFVLVQAAPDAVLVGFGRVRKAVITDWAAAADPPGRCTPVSAGWEEDVRVLAEAQPAAVPFAECGGDRAGHHDGEQPGGLAVGAGVFRHGGSLRESRDGGAVVPGFA